MSNTKLGLEFNISEFKKGTTDAAKIVEKGFGDKTWKPANKEIQKLAFSIKKKVGNAISGLSKRIRGFASALTSVQGIVAGIFGAAVIGKAIGFIKEAVTASRALADSAVVLDRAIAASGESFDKKQFAGLTEDLSLQLGVDRTALNKTAASFLGRGFGGDAAQELTVLAAEASKVTGTSIEDAAKKMADALNGNVESAKELGIEFASTGDVMQDKIILAEKLQERFGQIGSALVNPSEQLQANLDNITTAIGDQLIPMLDPIITYINNILTAWREGNMSGDLQSVINTVQGIAGGLAQIVNVIVQIYNEAVAKFTAISSLGIFVIDALTATFTSGIPAMVQNLIKLAVDTLLNTLGATKVGQKILSTLGIDESLSEGLANSIKVNQEDFSSKVMPSFDALKETTKNAADEQAKTWRTLLGEETDTATGRLKGKLDALAAQGEEINQAAQDRLNNRERPDAQNLLSKKTQDEEKERLEKANAKTAAKQAARFSTNGEAGAGQKIGITILSRKPDQFRKVALR